MKIQSWGLLSNEDHMVHALSDRRIIDQQLKGEGLGLAYGMGRSYGDVCLNANGRLWLTAGLNHLIAFDQESGLLRCEAGVLLQDIQRLLVPRGWMLPVTPGTQMVTVGGAIANDVHGKNHHVYGSFGDHIQSLKLHRTDGSTIDCSLGENADLFAATIGGIGLTGVISEAEVQLKRVDSSWLDTETHVVGNLDEFFSLADVSEANWEQTVSWIDCVSKDIGRGLFMRANSAKVDRAPPIVKAKKSVPFVPPISLVNRLTLRPFNTLYYNLKKRKAGPSTEHYEAFSYPLDNLNHWNRMYGRTGFYQYQSVVPRSVGKDAVHAMLSEISRAGEGSFLAVLKTFGERQSRGLMSFPQPGVTLALDFPNRGEHSHRLFSRLDSIVREAKGRLYMAKDARMPKDLFEAGYPQLSQFLQYRDPGISSELSRRLMGY